MTWNDHDHHGEYAAAGHEHGYYDLAGVAEQHHRHHGLESEVRGLREDLDRALHRIRDLEDRDLPDDYDQAEEPEPGDYDPGLVSGHSAAQLPAGRPPGVCLCGSTRLADAFRRATLQLTLAGEIVLSIGCDFRSDSDLAALGELGEDPAVTKRRLDELHKRKIDLADYVLVLNVGGYIGESTRSEIGYAVTAGKPVRYLEPLTAAAAGVR